MSAKRTPALGDIYYRVDGECIDDGYEVYCGMELVWTRWEIVKLTPRGMWLRCLEWPRKKQRFALASGARWVSATREEALERLVARKRHQLSILDHQTTMAQDTLALATQQADSTGGAK